MMKIISGGQTGADQGGLFAARDAGLPTGGWAPKGWKTDDGEAGWLEDYGLREWHEPGYPSRTRANAKHADVTLWFGRTGSPGYWCTRNACIQFKKPFVEADGMNAKCMATYLTGRSVSVINIAGNRESKNPGIEQRTREYLAELFAALGVGNHEVE